MRTRARRIVLAGRGKIESAPPIGCRGQAATEYVIALVLGTLGLIVMLRIFQIAIVGYLGPIYFGLGLPVP